MSTRRALLVACLVTGGWSCQEEPERPPPGPPCMGAGCVPGGGMVGPGPISGGGSDGVGEAGEGGEGAGARAGGGGTASRSLRGDVREFTDLFLENSIAFTGDATLTTVGVTGQRVTARWNGIDPYEFAALGGAAIHWVLVEPAADRGVLPTLHPVPARAPLADLGLIRGDSLDLVFLLLTVSTQRTEGRAQLVLRFVDDTSSTGAASGVRVALPEAEFVSYATQGGWSELEEQTDRTGLVVLGNIAAPEYPGVTKRVILDGARMGSVDVRVAADAVSVVEVAPP